MKKYLESKLIHLKGIKKIRKLHGEASNRSFFRVSFDNDSLVAMVYPEENKEEIEKIARLTDLYRKHQLNVPEIKEIIANRIILQDDLGDCLVQTAFSRFRNEERKKILEKVAEMVIKLKGIPASRTASILDTTRMKWEMDFFVTHFAWNFCSPSLDFENLRQTLYRMIEYIGPIDTFAHRDFHSRNMLYHNDDIFLVDFQDSLRAPLFYDLVSFTFDAYLDLKSMREFFMDSLKKQGKTVDADNEQFWLTALQRNIKALGTFGFQVMVRKNLAYKKYINRTIRHILNNPLVEKFLERSIFNLERAPG
jgi:aminoglycoside/choline kinase family phosphotransferase